ncbi:MAG: hypothetical protein SPL15_04325 [Lachnospiraceae bacterium]|nr:hypothetical protein [Lachnospiraceae bacterium]
MKNKSWSSRKDLRDVFKTSLKTVFTRSCLCVIMSSLLVSACQKKDKPIDRNKVDIGVVITTEQSYNSKILWLDSQLEKVQEQNLKYARLGTQFYSPESRNGKLFLIPQGLGKTKDAKKVISIDKKSLAIEEYPFTNIAINHMANIGNQVYAVNSGASDSCIESYNTKEHTNKIVQMDQTYLYSIIPADDRLLGFSTQAELGTTKSKVTMNVFTSELQLLKEIDISNFGIPTRKYCEDDTDLYITVNYNNNDTSTGKILKINKKDYHIKEISLKQDFPNDIYKYGDHFIVKYFYRFQNIGTTVSVLDSAGRERNIDLKTELALTAIKDEKFFVANNSGIQVYSIPDFKLLKEYSIDVKSSHYASALLVVE